MNIKSAITKPALWMNVAALAIALVQIYQSAPWFNPQAQLTILAVANAIIHFCDSQGITLSMPTKNGPNPVQPGVQPGSCGRAASALILALGLSVLVSMGMSACAGTSTTPAVPASPAVSLEQQQAALTYLQSSLTNFQAAATTAKAQKPADAAKIDAEVTPVLTQLQGAITTYEANMATASTSGTSSAWATAESILSTAVEVVGPYAIAALVH
jgi:cytochrome c556